MDAPPRRPVARVQIRESVIELIQGDITRQDADAIVNAANRTLLGGGGVDGAIFSAAGYEKLIAETRPLGGCETGDAKITSGCNLRARFIIHAVGPRYGPAGAPTLLASAYRRSLEVAREHGITSIAFPAISTGVFGYPVYEAAPIALRTICDFLAADHSLTLVRLVLFSSDTAAIFVEALASLVEERDDLNFC